MSNSLRSHGLSMEFSGQNTGVGNLSLLQGIFPTQGSNLGLPHCSGFFTSWATREAQEYWSGFTFSRGSSWTGVSCTSSRFFTNWAIREAQCSYHERIKYLLWIFFFFWLCLWDLSSPTRDPTWAIAVKAQNLTTRQPGNSPTVNPFCCWAKQK